MAVSYDLEIATPASLAQVAGELLDIAGPLALFDVSVTAELLVRDGAATRIGTWIRVYDPKVPSWAPVVTDLRITPTAAIGFVLYKHDKIPEQQDDMVQLVSGVLDRIIGDALLSGMETIWLLRRDGDVSVNERDDIWPPRRLALLHQQYRRVTHAFAEE